MPGSAGAKATRWTDKARSDLLRAVMEIVKISKSDWDQILPKVHAEGYTYTADAAMYSTSLSCAFLCFLITLFRNDTSEWVLTSHHSQHLAKLTKKIDAEKSADGSGTGDAGPSTDAAQEANAAPKRKRAAPKKAAGAAAKAPRAKASKTSKAKAKAVKGEQASDEDDCLEDDPNDEDDAAEAAPPAKKSRKAMPRPA
jgi:hypothetical protein